MTFTNIAAVATLGQAIDEIRERTGTISEEESELYFLPLANMLHDALLLVKSKQDPGTMKRIYLTEPASVNEVASLIDVSALDIASYQPEDLTYSDSVNGMATMMNVSDYESVLMIYPASTLDNLFIAYVGNVGGTTDGKMQIRVYRGSGLTAPGTKKLGYIRNPIRQLTASGKMDATEQMVREAIEVVVGWVPQRLKGAQ